MKLTPKQLLMNFYLELLTIPINDKFRALNQRLYGEVLSTLAAQLGEDREVVQNIFERMAAEDDDDKTFKR